MQKQERRVPEFVGINSKEKFICFSSTIKLFCSNIYVTFSSQYLIIIFFYFWIWFPYRKLWDIMTLYASSLKFRWLHDYVGCILYLTIMKFNLSKGYIQKRETSSTRNACLVWNKVLQWVAQRSVANPQNGISWNDIRLNALLVVNLVLTPFES